MFADGEHVDGGEDAGFLADGVEGRTEGDGVDSGGQHSHLIAFHAIEALGGSAESAEDVASADDDAYLDAEGGDRLDLRGVFRETVFVDTVLLGAHERFAA